MRHESLSSARDAVFHHRLVLRFSELAGNQEWHRFERDRCVSRVQLPARALPTPDGVHGYPLYVEDDFDEEVQLQASGGPLRLPNSCVDTAQCDGFLSHGYLPPHVTLNYRPMSDADHVARIGPPAAQLPRYHARAARLTVAFETTVAEHREVDGAKNWFDSLPEPPLERSRSEEEAEAVQRFRDQRPSAAVETTARSSVVLANARSQDLRLFPGTKPKPPPPFKRLPSFVKRLRNEEDGSRFRFDKPFATHSVAAPPRDHEMPNAEARVAELLRKFDRDPTGNAFITFVHRLVKEIRDECGYVITGHFAALSRASSANEPTLREAVANGNVAAALKVAVRPTGSLALSKADRDVFEDHIAPAPSEPDTQT
jgi:hypothetical protein